MEPIVIDDVTDVIADVCHVSRIFISWKRHKLTSEGSIGIFLMSCRQLFLVGQKVSELLYNYIFVGTVVRSLLSRSPHCVYRWSGFKTIKSYLFTVAMGTDDNFKIP